MEMTAKRLRKREMKTKLIFEPSLIFEIRSKFQDCPLRSMHNKLSGSRRQYHSTVRFRDTCIGLGAATDPTEVKSALKLSVSTATSAPASTLQPYACVKVWHTEVCPYKRRHSSATFKSRTGFKGAGSLMILNKT